MKKLTVLEYALYKAVESNNYAEAEHLIKQFKVAPKTPAGVESILHLAVRHRNHALLQLLIDAKAALNAYWQSTRPIEYAVKLNDWAAVMVFASQQRPPMNANYGYALIRAIAAKKHHVVQVLLQTSYSLYAQLLYDNNYNYSCLGLHVAVLNRDIPMILLLRAYNYPDTAADHLGTATEFAANRQQWGCLNALIHKNPKEEYLKYQKEQAEKEKQLIEAKKQNIATTLKKNAYELNDKIIQHYKPNNGNKEELVNDIINHAGENKQQALLECMVPETYLGKILHEKRGLWAPVPHRGCLKKVMEALQNEIIDWKTVDSKIVNKILSNADIKRHYPNFYERVAIFSREEKQATEAYPAENPYTNDKPPAYKDAMKEKANPVIYMPIRTETSTRKMSR